MRKLTCGVKMKNMPIPFGDFLGKYVLEPMILQHYTPQGLRQGKEINLSEPSESSTPGRLLWLGNISPDRIAGMIALQPNYRRFTSLLKNDDTVTLDTKELDQTARNISWFVYSREFNALLYQYIQHHGLGPKGFLELFRGKYQQELTQVKQEERKSRPRKEHQEINAKFDGKLDYNLVTYPTKYAELLKNIKQGKISCTRIVTTEESSKSTFDMGPLRIVESINKVEYNLSKTKPDESTNYDASAESVGLIAKFKEFIKKLTESFSEAKLTAKTSDGRTETLDLFDLDRAAAIEDVMEDTVWPINKTCFAPKSFPYDINGQLLEPIQKLEALFAQHQALFKLTS